MNKLKKIIRGLVAGFGFFILYYVVSMAVSFVTELAVILRYYPSYITSESGLTEEQYDLLVNKLYSLNGLMNIITTVLVIGIVALIFLFKGLDAKNILGMRKPQKGFAWLSYFGGIFTGVSLSCLITMLPVPEAWNEANDEAVGAVTSGNPLLVIISIFISAPLLEEFVFRGGMMGFIKKNWNTAAAVIIPAVIFGVIHGNILQGLYTFAAALVFSYFRLKGKSFWCAFLAHCGFNMSNILTALMGSTPAFMKFVVGTVALAVVFYGAEHVFSEKIKKDKETNE
ncbi:MAG: CPBP family intramembrane metalloprotease [Clostridia bacterium]|nr:CPBP family intramembrane metalloprotease [Clostridia bacterium]